jgi:MFS family permease
MASLQAGGVESGHQPRKAAISGWIGSTLEFYDFFIFATASALVFPQIFFPSDNPTAGIFASLATYGVGYVARPLGAVFLGHWGDTHGRKSVLVLCMFMMGISTVAVGFLPTYSQVGLLAPLLLIILRLIQGFAVAGEISGSSSLSLEHAPFGRRGYFASFTTQGVQSGQILAAAVFLPIATYMPSADFNAWGWRIPFFLSGFVLLAAWIIRKSVNEGPAFDAQRQRGEVPKAPFVEAVKTSWDDMLRVTCIAAMNVIPSVTTIFGAAYAVQPAYGIGLPKELFLWIPLVGNAVAVLVIPFAGNLSDKIGRKPLVVAACLSCGLLSFAYLYSISIRNVPMMLFFSMLMWGVCYQGHNGVFPAFFPELFTTRVRVTAMAIGQNVGTAATALLPAIFVSVAPPGSAYIPLTVGCVAFAVTVVAAIAALTARETYRLRIEDLGKRDAVPVSEEQYREVRANAMLTPAPAKS